MLSYKNCGNREILTTRFNSAWKSTQETKTIFMWQKLCNTVLTTSHCYKMCSTVLKVLFYTNVKLHAFNLLNVTYTHVRETKGGCFILRLCQLLRLYRVDCRLMKYENGVLVEWYSQGKTVVLGNLPVPLPTNPTQVDLRSNPGPRSVSLATDWVTHGTDTINVTIQICRDSQNTVHLSTPTMIGNI